MHDDYLHQGWKEAQMQLQRWQRCRPHTKGLPARSSHQYRIFRMEREAQANQDLLRCQHRPGQLWVSQRFWRVRTRISVSRASQAVQGSRWLSMKLVKLCFSQNGLMLDSMRSPSSSNQKLRKTMILWRRWWKEEVDLQVQRWNLGRLEQVSFNSESLVNYIEMCLSSGNHPIFLFVKKHQTELAVER